MSPPPVSELMNTAVAYIRQHSDSVPEIALVLGSGLGELADDIQGVKIPYTDIPGFPVSTAPNHHGILHIGTLHGRSVVAMQGRVHLYEGYSPAEIIFPTRVMIALGAQILLLTNAAGALNPDFDIGDLVAVEDHLSLANLGGNDPLRGPNDPVLGERFVSLNKAYSPDLITQAQAAGSALGHDIKRGAYAFVAGPSFETPAEIRMLRAIGADLVGMSTVPEVIAARHMGASVLVISTVTNKAVSTIDDDHITHEGEIWENMVVIKPRLRAVIEKWLSGTLNTHASLKNTNASPKPRND